VPAARPQAAGKPGEEPTFGISVTDVQVDPEVVDGHAQVEGLTKADFAIFDETDSWFSERNIGSQVKAMHTPSKKIGAKMKRHLKRSKSARSP